jgi:hypothetical protein
MPIPVSRVEHQVDDDLLDLAAVDDHSQRTIQLERERPSVPEKPRDRLLHIPYQAIEVDRMRHVSGAPAEGQQLAGDGRRTIRRVPDVSVVASPILPHGGVAQQEIAGPQHDDHHVVDLVGDSTSQRPDGFHLLRFS